MGPIEQSIKQKVEANFAPTFFIIENESSGHARGEPESHFKAVIVSNVFESKTKIERSRLVLNLLESERSQGLHAFTFRTYTPSEWETQKDKAIIKSPLCNTRNQ